MLARYLCAQGQVDEAAILLQRMLAAAETGGRISRVIEILVIQSLLLQTQDENDQAIAKLEEALILAEPGGFIRIFVDEGPPMARLLYESLSSEILPDYVRRLLAAFPIPDPEKAT